MARQTQLERRIDALHGRLRAGTDGRPGSGDHAPGGVDGGLLAETKDVLSEGYPVALAEEGRLLQLDRRLEALLAAPDAVDARALRVVVAERRAHDDRARRLRVRLSALGERLARSSGPG